VLLVQVGTVFAPPAGHSVAEQHPVSGIHVLVFKQRFCPSGHVPLQAAFAAMHVPLQFCGKLLGQLCTHAVPLQLTVPPTGAWQGVVHSVRPQVFRELLLTHVPLQLWCPALQRTEHAPL
jgi:hypothetical protein